VTQALRDAEWRAHHRINVAGLRGTPDLIAEAARAGWRADDPTNIAPLPASPAAREKLKAAGANRPVHDSGHPNWNFEVKKALDDIPAKLEQRGIAPGSDEYARAAREELEKLQDWLRQEMAKFDRLTQNKEKTLPVFS
jgi:hypothetical protein